MPGSMPSSRRNTKIATFDFIDMLRILFSASHINSHKLCDSRLGTITSAAGPHSYLGGVKSSWLAIACSRDFFSGVGRHPAHDGQQGAAAHVACPLLMGVPEPDGSEKLVVFLLIHISAAAVCHLFSPVIECCMIEAVPWCRSGNRSRRSRCPASAGTGRTILPTGIFVNHGKVIVDVSIHRSAALAGRRTQTLHGRFVVHGPSPFIQTVNVLLDDVIAGEPGEIQPVAKLPFHVGSNRASGLAVPTAARQDN